MNLAGEMKVEPFGHVALQHLDRLELEFDDLAAGRADEVVVMISLEGALVPRNVTERNERHLQKTGVH